jgi:hypothetical protein
MIAGSYIFKNFSCGDLFSYVFNTAHNCSKSSMPVESQVRDRARCDGRFRCTFARDSRIGAISKV